MGKPKRINVYAEAKKLSEMWKLGQKNDVIVDALKSGPKKALIPALIYHNLVQSDQKIASQFLKAVVDATVRN